MLKKLTLILLLTGFFPGYAYADVSLLLHEAIGVSGEFTAGGHAAIYFSNICLDGTTGLRMCQPGEQGVVMAAYPGFGANKPYEWLAVPWFTYLYGVGQESEVPLYANGEIRTLLRGIGRRQYFNDIIPATANGALPPGRWQEMIGTLLNRDVYMFTLKTSWKEDVALVETYNSRANKRPFNVLYQNCADFVREAINTYFPKAAHRDMLNDFTITTPKALARSLTRYATKRPERLFYITKYSQYPGPIRRSLDTRNFSEKALTSKKYLVPQIVFKPILLPIFATAYFTTGRFNPERAYEQRASLTIAQLELEANQLRQHVVAPEQGNSLSSGAAAGSRTMRLLEIERERGADRERIFGTKQTWKNYQMALQPLLHQAIAQGYFVDEREMQTFFKDLELQSEPDLDASGALELHVRDYGVVRRLGLTRANILSAGSDPQLAYKLMLVRVKAQLTGPPKNREAMESFTADWALLQELAQRCAVLPAPNTARTTAQARFLEHPEKTTFKQKMKKLLLRITH